MNYFTGRTENPTYIADSSLKRIKSIKHHSYSASNVTYVMLFDSVPLKVGSYSQNTASERFIFTITGMSSLSIRPSTMSKTLSGIVYLAGTNINNRWNVVSLNVVANTYFTYERDNGYADSLNV